MAINQNSDTENYIKLVLSGTSVSSPKIDIDYKLISTEGEDLYHYGKIIDSGISTSLTIQQSFWSADTMVRQQEGLNIIGH